MFLILGQPRTHDDMIREIVRYDSLTHAKFVWKLTEVIAYFRECFERSSPIDRNTFTFREWLTYQSGFFMVFFLSPYQNPKQMDWIEIKAIVKDMESR